MITREQLRQACYLAIASRASGEAVTVKGHHRFYNQRFYECGSACCIHGFAHLLRYGKPFEPGLVRGIESYYMEGIPSRCFDVLKSENGKPETILRILNEDDSGVTKSENGKPETILRIFDGDESYDLL